MPILEKNWGGTEQIGSPYILYSLRIRGRAVHKGRPQMGGGGLSKADVFRRGGWGGGMWTSAKF